MVLAYCLTVLLYLYLQGKGYEDVVSTLRNGSAAENAFALMREKGLLLPRRSRHRLTPGTVKFAAFHVLSLEGSKGLTVLELADKIQVSVDCVPIIVKLVVSFTCLFLIYLFPLRNLDFGTSQLARRQRLLFRLL